MIKKVEKDWKKELSEEQYKVLREKGTEYPGTGEYLHHEEGGIYRCAGCQNEIFDSFHKYDSGCGWPSFDNAKEGSVEYVRDTSLDMERTEVVCVMCGGHLGHVFPDGPKETTGNRFCINSVSLDFEKKK
ncbi:MAG: peptide-methionine (R)-S-oxide reductase [Flavobacteriaceae bacterium]|jgi:peptide-methionine (R)-S-oxide reductase